MKIIDIDNQFGPYWVVATVAVEFEPNSSGPNQGDIPYMEAVTAQILTLQLWDASQDKELPPSSCTAKLAHDIREYALERADD